MDDGLLEETNRIKLSLDRKIKELKLIIKLLIENKNYPIAWEYLQNFWWLRLGLHEFVFDVQFYPQPLPINDVRDYVLVAIYNKIDLSKETPSIFKDKQIIDSLRYRLAWHRYGMCSYDCGPLAVGREGFVPFNTAANQIKNTSVIMRLNWMV